VTIIGEDSEEEDNHTVGSHGVGQESTAKKKGIYSDIRKNGKGHTPSTVKPFFQGYPQ